MADCRGRDRGRRNTRNNNNNSTPSNNQGGGRTAQRNGKHQPTKSYDDSHSEDDFSDEDYLSPYITMDDLIVTSPANHGKKAINNLNHLLNFSYAERAKAPPPPRGNKSYTTRRRAGFDKERFVHANYRFVVQDNQDLSKYLLDPDVSVDWDSIVEVHVFSNEPCPICLDTPVAPKMTKCGHIYCWSCMIRYLNEDTKAWRRCPICFEAVSMPHLKSVVMQPSKDWNEGQPISFTLLQRAREYTVCLPRAHWSDYGASHFLSCSSDDAAFSRLSVVSDLGSAFKREKRIIADAISVAEATHDETLPYLVEAQNMLSKQYDAYLDASIEVKTTTSKSSLDANATPFTPGVVVQPMHHSSSDVSKGKLSDSSDSNYVLFFQESSGTLIFLHPLNIRMLTEEYGAPEEFPDKIEGTILELEEVAITNEMRKRYKYFRHLPQSCSVLFCELDLSKLVSKNILSMFHQQLSSRASRRSQRLKEKVAPKAAHSGPSLYEELHQIATEAGLPLMTPNLTPAAFPAAVSTTSAVIEPLPTQKSTPPVETYAQIVSPTIEVPASSSSSSSSTPSFADALKGNGSKQGIEAMMFAVPVKKGKKGKHMLLISNSSSRGYR